MRHQSDWSKVSLYSSPSFLSKNLLVKEGPDSVVPVVISALPPTPDKSLKADSSLCPARVPTVWTGPQAEQRVGLCLFQERLQQRYPPATISSWIMEAVIVCYELFASKAFQLGVSMKQILSVCHWKLHTIFTQFYSKDVA